MKKGRESKGDLHVPGSAADDVFRAIGGGDGEYARETKGGGREEREER